MKRLTLVVGCAVVVLTAVVVLLLRRPQPPVAPPLALPDGSSVRVLAVTYGTNHVVGPPFARFVAHLPAGAQPLFSRLFGRRAQAHTTTTLTPSLVVWLEPLAKSTNPASGAHCSALLSDQRGFISGPDIYIGGWASPEPLRFEVFPRRDAVLGLELFYHDPNGEVKRCGRLPIANPAGGSFPQWPAEALPASKRTGEVEVTLEKLSTGHDHHVSYQGLPGGGAVLDLGTNRLDGRNQTVCLVRLRSLTQTNTVWQVAGVEVSDATGNRTRNRSMSWGGHQDYFTFEPGLWLSEAAWQLKYELKRLQGFAPGETFTFQNVPLGTVATTNRLNWRTNFAGLTITLTELVHRPPLTNNSWSSYDLSACTFTISGLTNGQHLDLLSARANTGTHLDVNSWSSSGVERTYNFRTIPAAAQTADFTFAVQSARWVEFMVQPEVGALRLESKPGGKP